MKKLLLIALLGSVICAPVALKADCRDGSCAVKTVCGCDKGACEGNKGKQGHKCAKPKQCCVCKGRTR